MSQENKRSLNDSGAATDEKDAAPQLLQWSTTPIRLHRRTRANPENILWSYAESGDFGGCIHIFGSADEFVTVETDSSEGSAMFPGALLDEVIKRLIEIRDTQ